METVLSIILIIGFIFLLGIWSLTALYSLACDVNAEKKKMGSSNQKRDGRMVYMTKNVRTIPATVNLFNNTPINSMKKRRVAAYARVSTDQEEQLTSYEAQVDYYTNYIKARDDWEFLDVYTDECISGTSTKHREGFKKMVDNAMAGNIDLIITKSVSRFARNTVDSLATIRSLKEIGCECYFEKENIWTFDGKGELLLTIMSSLAQEESRSISENVKWGHRKRFADGKVSVPFSNFLGYKKGKDGNLVWNASTVRSILKNEKYKGDALLQKKLYSGFSN